ncbi:serine/threonine-protein kinase Nek6-like, partial [Capsicum annuum]|uniref:serine/threonine-protein kinase Nek6-like n=1 Tax=Capsicum annuum TaxID=4072 RepID=UPI001FB1039E
AEVMRKSRGALFPEEKLCKWLTHLLLALEHLHSYRVHHRDLKLCNIFITKDNNIRLGDFGLGKLLDTEGLGSSVFGTPNDMCPELLAGIPYGYKSDIWSVGYCMFDIAAHQPPFKASDKTGLINKINRGFFSPLPIIYSSTLKQIIKSMLRKTLEHQPIAADLLRHQYLEPYLLLCHNPSSAFLPVKSPSRTKEKTRPSPGKSISPRGRRDRKLKLKEKRTVLYFDESDNIQPRNLSDNYNTVRAKLDTKRVDPTSYSVRISQDSEDSKSGKMSEETEQEHVSPENDSRFDEGDTKNNKTKELEVECISAKSSRMTLSDGRFNDKTLSFDEESTSSNSQSAKPDPEAAPRCCVAEIENGSECREVTIDCLSTESDGSLLHKEELEKKAIAVYDTKQAKKDALRALDDKVSQLKSLAALASKEEKDDWGNPTEQRAKALESLLEVCARLLRQEKIDELAGVLKPFGDDRMLSRETAIWLTKCLMTAQKLSKGS